jgi:prepilin-type N-terminal cleavage/methylation domain-containing protein
MLKKRRTRRKGLTLVELMIAAALLGISILGVGIALVESQRGWNKMYNRIYSAVVTDGEATRRTFDSVVRKSSRGHILLDEAGSWVEVRHYEGLDSAYLDRYARFYTSGDELKVEYGSIDAAGETAELLTQTLCSNVSSCVFTSVEGSVQMVVKLDNGSETGTVISSAIAQN